MAKNTLHPPLQERVPLNNTLHRLVECVILFLLFCLLLYRLVSLPNGGSVWLVASICESWFTLVWVLFMNAKWSPVLYKTYPDHLTKRFDDLPAVDMFVTTADPKLEPPIVTVNTVLSMLAVEYPAEKLACYVSDDGCSPISFYSLVEASKFAKLWVPFCKKHNVEVRAPFAYFSSEPKCSSASAPDFADDWAKVKNEYEELSSRIENAEKCYIPHHMNDEFAEFLNTERKNHPTIIKVIWENKGDLGESFPHLIYVAREKRPKYPHHFKAGAMNVLTRVSGVMTNAPFMLNVDCDMFVNNPKVILHAMCLLLGFENDVHSAFVQAPQQFYGALKDDPFGNQLVVLQKKVGLGMAGIQGPFYGGTGCFHRRKIIYGSSPDTAERNKRGRNELQRLYGNSTELIDSATRVISGTSRDVVFDPSSRVDAAQRVASCTYELNTCWGAEIGWVYGSMTEDIQTGLRIHSMGWESKYMALDPPAFLGSAPVGGPSSLTQYKRWATGLLEVLLGRNSPLVAVFRKRLTVRQCLAYLLINVWALRAPLRAVLRFDPRLLSPHQHLLHAKGFSSLLPSPFIHLHTLQRVHARRVPRMRSLLPRMVEQPAHAPDHVGHRVALRPPQRDPQNPRPLRDRLRGHPQGPTRRRRRHRRSRPRPVHVRRVPHLRPRGGPRAHSLVGARRRARPANRGAGGAYGQLVGGA